jgi:uncharacterized protein DUF4349
MRQLLTLMLGIALAGGLAACKAKGESRVAGLASPAESDAAVTAERAEPQGLATSAKPAQAPPPVPKPVAISRKLVRTVDLELQVKATEPASKQVQELAVRLGGYVAAVDAQRTEGLLFVTLTVRVPVDRLDEAVAAIEKLAVRVEHEQQRVEDVTDRAIDLGARLRTLQATERELQALLAESRQRQRKVEEIMAVYHELVEIRSQIEQIQGQLTALEQLAALSTINVRLRPAEAARPVAPAGWRPTETAHSSVRTLVEVLRVLIDLAIYVLIVFLPVALLFVLAFLLLRSLLRRLRRRPASGPRP